MAVKEVLEERGSRYGNYLDQTTISKALQNRMRATPKYHELDSDMQDALEMIAVKISRILNGDPDYADNWSDIAGYATLVEERLKQNDKA
jgi:hypothetical protein